MGHGTYSSLTRSVRSMAMGYTTKAASELFTERSLNNAMDPHGITFRESRDSAEHPNSVAIIVALDETGSMGSIPHFLLKEGLDDLVQGAIDAGIADPQLLFLGIGDHTCDRAPLQVGQFESSDELLDHWLKTVYLEGSGGGNDGESYLLAWYFAAFHTSIDCFEKRGRKGLLFTIGDEPCLDQVDGASLKKLMGPGQYLTMTAKQLLEAARQKYEVYHLNMKQTRSGSRDHVAASWKALVGNDHYIDVLDQKDVGRMIQRTIVRSIPAGDPHRIVRV